MHKEGSLSWAAEHARLAKVDVWQVHRAAYWCNNTHSLRWRDMDRRVCVVAGSLGGWTIKETAPTSLGDVCPKCGLHAHMAGYGPWCGCVPTPESQTEDIPIDAFQRLARAIRSGSIFDELQFEASIQCYLYADGKGGLLTFNAPIAWRGGYGASDRRLYPDNPNIGPDDWDGDFEGATHVRLLKKKEDGQ